MGSEIKRVEINSHQAWLSSSHAVVWCIRFRRDRIRIGEWIQFGKQLIPSAEIFAGRLAAAAATSRLTLFRGTGTSIGTIPCRGGTTLLRERLQQAAKDIRCLFGRFAAGTVRCRLLSIASLQCLQWITVVRRQTGGKVERTIVGKYAVR